MGILVQLFSLEELKSLDLKEIENLKDCKCNCQANGGAMAGIGGIAGAGGSCGVGIARGASAGV